MLISCVLNAVVLIRLTKKAEPPPTRDANRDSGTESANGGWLRRLVRRHGHLALSKNVTVTPATFVTAGTARRVSKDNATKRLVGDVHETVTSSPTGTT